MAIYDDDDDSQAPYGADARWDDDEDRNGPAARDIVPDDRTTAPCTSCRKLIFDDSPRCPYCGDYQMADARNRKPLWFWVAVILCLGMLGGFSILAALTGILRWRG